MRRWPHRQMLLSFRGKSFVHAAKVILVQWPPRTAELLQGFAHHRNRPVSEVFSQFRPLLSGLSHFVNGRVDAKGRRGACRRSMLILEILMQVCGEKIPKPWILGGGKCHFLVFRISLQSRPSGYVVRT